MERIIILFLILLWSLSFTFKSFKPMQVAADISPGRRVEPGQEAWHLPPLTDLNRFAEKASNFRRRLANLVGMKM